MIMKEAKTLCDFCGSLIPDASPNQNYSPGLKSLIILSDGKREFKPAVETRIITAHQFDICKTCLNTAVRKSFI